MMKTIIVGALILCANAFLSVTCSLEKATITRSLTISDVNSTTVPFNGHLYTITNNQSHIHINSTDSKYKTCDIAIDPAKDVINSYLDVTATDKEFFIVGVRGEIQIRDHEVFVRDQYKYTILRIDPLACNYQSVLLDESNPDGSGIYHFARVTSRRTGIDIFFPRFKICSPCRFDDKGSRISGSTVQIPQENPTKNYPYEKVDVEYVEPLDAYFYYYEAYNYVDNVLNLHITKLKLLDSNDFKTLKERTINFKVDAISRPKKSNGHLGVCTRVSDDPIFKDNPFKEIRCHKLNSNLDTSNVFVWTPTESPSSNVSSVSYEFDDEGNSYISFAEETALRLYVVDKDGKLIKAIDMGEVDDKFKQYSRLDASSFRIYNFWDVKGFLVGNEYCIVTKQSIFEYRTPVHQVRCVDVKQYLN